MCQLEYGDFVLWVENGLAVERITRDTTFYEQNADSVKHFFVYGILPDIVGKWYSRKPVANTDGIVSLPETVEATMPDEAEDFEKLWFFCREPSQGNMILCDNPRCTLKWFHFDCLRRRRAPKGKWYCPSYCKLPQFTKKKKQS